MKNKGFVLIETIVVIVVIGVSLLTLYSSYNRILSKVKAENKYDNSDYMYMTYYIREYLKKDNSITAEDIKTSTTITNHTVLRKKILEGIITEGNHCKFLDVDGNNVFEDVDRTYLARCINDPTSYTYCSKFLGFSKYDYEMLLSDARFFATNFSFFDSHGGCDGIYVNIGLPNADKIYILTNLNKLTGNEDKFDAYMIDYIRKLDVLDNDSLIIVEYKRPKKIDGTNNYLCEYGSSDCNVVNSLNETFIASLEW